jgi:hypothetical protein
MPLNQVEKAMLLAKFETYEDAQMAMQRRLRDHGPVEGECPEEKTLAAAYIALMDCIKAL